MLCGLDQGRERTLCRCSGDHLAAAPPPSQPCTGLRPTATSPTHGLQEAIDAAAAGSTLTLCAGTWVLTTTVVIAKNLTLRGAGSGTTTLDGGQPPGGPGGVLVLQIAAGATVTLQDLTITKGNGFPAGGISNEGTLTLVGVTVTNNGGDGGGGMANVGGTLTLGMGTRVTDNGTGGAGAGGVRNTGTMTMEAGSRVSGNGTTGDGGGIFNSGTLTLEAGSLIGGTSAEAKTSASTVAGSSMPPPAR